MNKEKALIIITITNCLIIYLFSKTFDYSILDMIGYVITLTLLELLLFKKWLWKIKIIQNITGIINIQGVWNGKLLSKYDNTEHTIEKLIIKQSYDKYKVIMETIESRSTSGINKLTTNEFNRLELQYIYTNYSPSTLRKKNPMHFGVAKLELKDNKLFGEYWTDREIGNGKNTRGTMQLVKTVEKGNYDLIKVTDIFELF